MDTNPSGEAPPESPPNPQPGRPSIPSSKDEQTFAMLAHLLGIVGFVGPLVIWLVKREQSPFVNDQAKEALNFQITVAIAWVALVSVSQIPFVGCMMAVAGPAVGIANLIFCILAGVQANQGIAYRYPVALRLIK